MFRNLNHITKLGMPYVLKCILNPRICTIMNTVGMFQRLGKSHWFPMMLLGWANQVHCWRAVILKKLANCQWMKLEDYIWLALETHMLKGCEFYIAFPILCSHLYPFHNLTYVINNSLDRYTCDLWTFSKLYCEIIVSILINEWSKI